MRERGASLFGALVLLGCASCLSVQDFSRKLAADGPDAAGPGGSLPSADGSWRWKWINPAPTGRTLVAIGGTSDRDVWVAGEGGTIAHFDGTAWDIRHLGPATTRYFSVGTRQPGDVWVAGTSEGQLSAVHYDGTEWVDSYPFAGSALSGFSHGTGPRLFAVVEWSIFELADDGTWKKTDTTANVIHGAPVDVWVSTSGEAWALTTGAALLHLPADSQTWEVAPAVAGVPSLSTGLALSGAGTSACAFYTGTASAGFTGFMRYDGKTWKTGPTSARKLTAPESPHGPLSACLNDGSGFYLADNAAWEASLTEAPSGARAYDFEGESFLGAWSLDGSKAYVVGGRGTVARRGAASGADFASVGPTFRQEILGVDVGLDGNVALVDTLQADRSAGGEVRFWQDGALTTRTTSGFSAPGNPVAITVVGKDDAWLLSQGAFAGVTHFTGKWGLTLTAGGSSAVLLDPLTIWAPAKDDVWITARARCPDFDAISSKPCSKHVAAFVYRFNGKGWTTFDEQSEYLSIHGTGPNDVWFAGNGVAHWDGTSLTTVSSLSGAFQGVWSSAKERVWLWGDRSILYDGTTSTPVEEALHTAADWVVQGIAESTSGDVFVLTQRGTGTSLLWFDTARTRLKEQVPSDFALTAIRGRGDELWAVGAGGAALRFAPPVVH